MCSGVVADVDGTTAARNISSPSGERGTSGCDTLAVDVGETCDSGMEVGLERGELEMGSAMNGDNDNVKQLVEKQSRVFAHAPVSELSARGSSPTLPSTLS